MSLLSRLVLALALAAAPVAAVVVEQGVALAGEQPIAVGTELEATSDVTLHQADIVKGSRVSVTKLLVKGGQLDGLSVALADGHVVKVTMNQVHTYFRVAE